MSQDEMRPRTDLKPLPRHTLGGGLNHHFAYEDPDGNILMRRRPFKDPAWEEIVKTNVAQWGFEGDGAKILIRTDEEVHAFVKSALEADLRVLPATSDGDHGSFTPYLERAVTLDVFLAPASDADAERTVNELVADIAKAHRANIVYGDRYPHNILVDPTLGVVHIDFDFKLEGPGRELDLAQAIFYPVALDRGRSPQILVPILESFRNDHDFTLVRKYVDAKERWSREKYGDLREVFQSLFE